MNVLVASIYIMLFVGVATLIELPFLILMARCDKVGKFFGVDGEPDDLYD